MPNFIFFVDKFVKLSYKSWLTNPNFIRKHLHRIIVLDIILDIVKYIF